MHPLGIFSREGRSIAATQNKGLFIKVNQKCSQGDVLEEESDFVQMGSGEHS